MTDFEMNERQFKLFRDLCKSPEGSKYWDLQAKIERLEWENTFLRARLSKYEALEQWQERNEEAQE